jgi:hypothetical protein
MPMTYWPAKTCGHCGLVSPNDLPKYRCDLCNVDYCPSCGGGQSTDGTLHCCRKCAMKKIPEVLKKKVAFPPT